MEERLLYSKYVVEAKKRGLSCGVDSVAASNLPDCPEDVWHNCVGAFTFTNGDRYVGEYRAGKRTGRGIYTTAIGGKYTGDFIHGRLNA